MNFDKMSYLFWSVIVLISILGAGILSNYGNMISEDKNFQTYFGWYIGILVANLFNILINLIFHFFMKDIEGKRGLKGEPGLRGKEGTDALCFCSDEPKINCDDFNGNLHDCNSKIGICTYDGKINKCKNKNIVNTGSTGIAQASNVQITNSGNVRDGIVLSSSKLQDGSTITIPSSVDSGENPDGTV